MKEIRIHARAGQGAITTAAILGNAYFIKGQYPYAFPHFGAARMGAPMNAFVRVDTKPVRLRSQIYEPDYIIVVDSTLMRGYNVFSGLKEEGVAIVNLREGIEIPKLSPKQRMYVIPANDIAMKTIGRPLGNTALLGAFSSATGQLDQESLIAAIKTRFSGKAFDANVEAIKQGYAYAENLKKQCK
ncbi:MAG: 2-oxoacid:acceptor oxidoreductase family protein [Deltaproteobacteria bacterium]